MSPATSGEHLNVRRANKVQDDTGPSAFRVVTPGSSKAVSREASVDNVATLVATSQSSLSGSEAISLIEMTATSEAIGAGGVAEEQSSTAGHVDDPTVIVQTDGQTVKVDQLPKHETFI